MAKPSMFEKALGAIEQRVDQVIGVVSPSLQASRLRARILTRNLDHAASRLKRRGYEGASRSERMRGWRTGSGSANSETQGAIQTLRNRSRDLVRNNPWARRGAAVITTNVVGAGIVPQAKAPRGGNRTVRSTQDLWKQWGETKACDFDGKRDFYGLQSLVMNTVVKSGEVLVRRVNRSMSEGLPVPLQLQVLEPDHIDTMKDGPLDGGGRCVQGVEFDVKGQIVAYWLFVNHPGDLRADFRAFESKRVPASEILHIFDADRPGQVRGVTWFAAVMLRLRDLDEYEEAQLLRQKISAAFAGFMTDNAVLGEEAAEGEEDELSPIEPGTLLKLPSGKSITFSSPPGAEGYPDYVRTVLCAVAAGLGITYESLTNDYGNVNFSSGRMGWVEMYRNIDRWRWQMLIPGFCDPAYDWFVIAADAAGKLKGPVRRSWTPPRREMLDPVKETDAIKAQVRAGLKSLSEAIREEGRDPEEVFDEIAEDNKALDDRGISLDTDPRKGSGGGAGRPAEAAKDEGEKPAKADSKRAS